MTRLHGSFSYERRPQSKPVASTIFPLALRANSSRKTKLPPLRVRRFALASRRLRRFGSIGPMALITESHRKRGIAPTMES